MTQPTVRVSGGWWPPGKQTPENWDYERSDLILRLDGDTVDVSIPEGQPGYEEYPAVSFPLAGLLKLIATSEVETE